jgi:hypothetical protein
VVVGWGGRPRKRSRGRVVFMAGALLSGVSEGNLSTRLCVRRSLGELEEARRPARRAHRLPSENEKRSRRGRGDAIDLPGLADDGVRCAGSSNGGAVRLCFLLQFCPCVLTPRGSSDLSLLSFFRFVFSFSPLCHYHCLVHGRPE